MEFGIDFNEMGVCLGDGLLKFFATFLSNFSQHAHLLLFQQTLINYQFFSDQVMATDLDAGTNAEISYEITGGMHRGNFSINAKTGLITTARALDYEALAKYELTVTARDGATTPKSSTVKVRTWLLYLYMSSVRMLSGFNCFPMRRVENNCL